LWNRAQAAMVSASYSHLEGHHYQEVIVGQESALSAK